MVGPLLQAALDAASVGQAELARRTGLSTKHINWVVKGRAPLSIEVAVLIEEAFPEIKAFPLLMAQLRHDVAGAKAKVKQAKQKNPRLFEYAPGQE